MRSIVASDGTDADDLASIIQCLGLTVRSAEGAELDSSRCRRPKERSLQQSIASDYLAAGKL
jgi:hypothetical protein